MYGQGGSFNPHYRHVAPPPQPPPAAPAATRPFPQQPPPPPLPHYPQHPSLPVQYQHGSPLQNQAYPYPQHGQPYPVPMPMPPQQRGFAPMPMHAPLPQALYRPPPHLPMPGSLPPPPPPPASFAPENVLPPSAPPPPPPPPPSSPPPAPPSPPTAPPAVQSSSVEPNKEEAAPVLIDESLPRGYDGKTEGVAISKAASSDSDMDMEGDEDSPFLQDLSPDMSSFATAGCTGDVNVVKSGNNVDLGDDLPLDSEGKAKSSTVTVEGRSSFQLIQGYASDNSQDSEHTGSANRCTEDSLHKLGNAKRHVNVRPGSEKSTELINHQIKHTSSPMEHILDEVGRQVKEDLSDSEFDGAQYSAKDGRSQRKRSLSPGSQSRPLLAKRANLHQEQESDRDMECSDFKRSRCFHGASCQYIHRSSEQQTKRQTRYHELNEDPSDTDEHDVSRTSEAQPDANLSKTKDELYNENHDKCVKDAAPVEIHLVDGEKVLEDDQGDLMGKKKSAGSSIAVNGKEEKGAAPDGAPGEHVHGEILTSGASQSLVASANVSDSLNTKRTGPSSQSQSRLDLDKASPPLLNVDRSLVNQSSTGVPFTSVHATENSMAHDVVHSHPQGLCSPNQMPSGFAPPLPLSSNLSPIPGQPSLTCSEYPQMQFPPNALTSGNEFLKNQMRTYPAPDLSHPKPLDFPHPLQPVIPSHRQPSFHTDELKRPFAVENAAVPLPDRWSDRPGVVSLSYSHYQPSYGQQQPPGSLASGTNMVYSSFQRFPSNLPESSVLVPMSDIGLPKSSIKPHFNPYASTFEQTDVSLDISPGLGPSAVGPASTKAAGHMNPVSPFGQLLPVSAEAVPNLQNQFRPGFASGDPYDPLFDSIEPSSSSINKVDLGQERNLSAGDSRNALKHLNTEAESKNKQRVGLIAESEVEELGEVAADAEAGVVENASPEPLGAKDWSIDLPDETNNDESSEKNKKSKDSRSMKLFKNAIADFVKEVLKPSWRQGNMSKEAFKTIVKKTVDKVSSSVPSSHIPKTQAKINQYVQSSQRKMTKLVMGYVDKYVKI